jgi:hypothetical protein
LADDRIIYEDTTSLSSIEASVRLLASCIGLLDLTGCCNITIGLRIGPRMPGLAASDEILASTPSLEDVMLPQAPDKSV